MVDGLVFPEEDSAVRAELQMEADAAGVGTLYRRLETFDPVAAAKIEPGNVRRVVRALEVPAITGSPFSTFAVHWQHRDPGRVRVAGVRMPADVLARRITERISEMFAAGWLEEVQGLLERGIRLVAHVDPGDRLRRARPPPRG